MSASSTHRAAVLVPLFALAIAAFAPGAHAQQTMRLVVPFPVGTTIDVLARDLSAKLPAVLGQQMIVDNRPGASGNIGTEYVVGAPADGTTLLVTVHSSVTINPLIYEKLKYSTNDLVPVANLIVGGYLLAGSTKLPYRTVGDLVAAAKQKPDSITYASYGYGSMAHICMEMFQTAAAIKLRHVPYKSLFMTDLIAGHVDIAFENVGASIPQVTQKNLQAFAISHKPIAKLPGVPAVSDTVPGFDCFAWVGVFAPKGTPAATTRRLSDEITKIVATPAFAALAEGLGAVATPIPMDKFGPYVRADFEKWRKVVPPLNIKVD